MTIFNNTKFNFVHGFSYFVLQLYRHSWFLLSSGWKKKNHLLYRYVRHQSRQPREGLRGQLFSHLDSKAQFAVCVQCPKGKLGLGWTVARPVVVNLRLRKYEKLWIALKEVKIIFLKIGTNMLCWGFATEGVCVRGGPHVAKADNE